MGEREGEKEFSSGEKVSSQFVAAATMTRPSPPLPLPFPRPCSVIGDFSTVADGLIEVALLQLVTGSVHHSPAQVRPSPLH